MKQQEVFKRIGGIIKELNDQFEYLKTIEGPLNELELGTFFSQLSFFRRPCADINQIKFPEHQSEKTCRET